MFDLMPFGRRNDWFDSLDAMEKDFFGGSKIHFVLSKPTFWIKEAITL